MQKTYIFISGKVARGKKCVEPCKAENGPHWEECYHGNQSGTQAVVKKDNRMN